MAVIFPNIDKFSSLLAVTFARLGANVYFINLIDNNNFDVISESLESKGVRALPIETLNNIEEWHHYINTSVQDDWLWELLPANIIATQKDLYHDITNIEAKLKTSLKTSINTSVNGKIATYAKAFPNEQHYIISSSILEFFLPLGEKNLHIIFIPNIASYLQHMSHFISKCVNIVKKFKLGNNSYNSHSEDTNNVPCFIESKVAFVVHQGLDYGGLFKKDLFYSSASDSFLSKKNLLHISYSGVYPSDDNINWYYVSSRTSGLLFQFASALKSVARSIFSIKKLRHLIGVYFLLVYYIKYTSYKKSLLNLKSIKLALIDYEILCPKPLLMAFESCGIKTVAVQERYFMSFYRSFGTFLDYYMCSSDFAEKKLKENSSYIVKNYIPVGQHRSDFLDGSSSVLPIEMKKAKKQNKKIIVALGFHTPLNRYQSMTDPILSWSAHIAFIEDMLDLASSIEDVFIVLRYKFVDWLELPIFSDIVKRVDAADNVTISTEYSIEYYSYRLCSNADLVIAKHTSLGDECLSRGIPVLFHDYTHNLKRIISSVYDYEDSEIICHDYNQLLSMSKKMLAGESKKYLDEIKYLYGSYGDGNVRNRIHQWLENKLVELNKRSNIQ